ncbi:hypothetical protein L2E82_10520 [Cichorium intybus]|uniref:Uncharacterized protein n=1 Tax=Cichorium intybus TaxID=13427 RepID=A0ACB9GBF2_CICIN|nr:hypothetical protein L2E82_10520 [Cichorium intybus]
MTSLGLELGLPVSVQTYQMGLTRMDAALDKVSCLGFSKPLIRRTVRNLLKVYGDDGWKLIEEDGYKVVLDVILDEQE